MTKSTFFWGFSRVKDLPLWMNLWYRTASVYTLCPLNWNLLYRTLKTSKLSTSTCVMNSLYSSCDWRCAFSKTARRNFSALTTINTLPCNRIDKELAPGSTNLSWQTDLLANTRHMTSELHFQLFQCSERNGIFWKFMCTCSTFCSFCWKQPNSFPEHWETCIKNGFSVSRLKAPCFKTF